MSDPGKREEEGLAQLLHRWGIRLRPDQTWKLNAFLDELVQWNKKINLTGPCSRQKIVNELLVDSILPTPFLPDEGTFLDVGSGAGFPAIPIKICKPRIRSHLIEPNKKKVSFLKQVIRVTRLRKIEVIEGRMEDQEGALLKKGYDVITSRAFVPLPGFLTLCAPHLSPEGCMVAFLGGRSELSIEKSAELIEMHRLFPFKRISYVIPEKPAKREILILRRRG